MIPARRVFETLIWRRGAADMGPGLFGENGAPTPAGPALFEKAEAALEPVLAEYRGYTPREAGRVLHGAVEARIAVPLLTEAMRREA